MVEFLVNDSISVFPMTVIVLDLFQVNKTLYVITLNPINSTIR